MLCAVCGAVAQAQTRAAATACQLRFPLQAGVAAGWQGADAAYSTPLAPGRAVWIFGDTLYGPQRAMDGADPRMVHNSLGLSTCSPAGWTIDYFLRQGPDGKPVSFFAPRRPDHWYWAMDVVHRQGELLIALLCLRHPAKPVTPAFNFEACGLDLARMPVTSELRSSPVTISTVVAEDGAEAYPASTMVPYAGNLYLFGARAAGSHALFVSRVPFSQLSSPAGALSTLATDNTWQKGTDLPQAKPLFAPAPSEMSIRYHAAWRRWLAVYKDPDLLSDQLLLRSAPSLTGPWSAPQLLFHIRPLDAAAALPGVFCYAGKEHPELANGTELLVTYVCNAEQPALLLQHPDLYRPKAVRVTLNSHLKVAAVKALDEPAASPSPAASGRSTSPRAQAK